MSNPSPSAGSVDDKLREVFGEIIDGAFRAGFRQSMSGHVGGWQRKAAIDGLIRNALTAAPAPVLVVELDQKENSTCNDGSWVNADALLSQALHDSEEWNGKHQRACLIIAEIETVSDNCINAEKFTVADAMADLQEIRNIIKRGKAEA